jgi:hypothetical protein
VGVELDHPAHLWLTALGRTVEVKEKSLQLTALGRFIEVNDKMLHLTAHGRSVEVQEKLLRLSAHGRYIEADYHTVCSSFLGAYMERERTRPIEASSTGMAAYVELASPEGRSTRSAAYVETKRRGIVAGLLGVYAEVKTPFIAETVDGVTTEPFIELHTRCRDMYRVMVEWETLEQGQISGDQLPADLEGLLQPIRGARPRYYQGVFIAYRENDTHGRFIHLATVRDLKMLWRYKSRILFLRSNGILDRTEVDCVKVYWANDLSIEWVAGDLPYARIPFLLVEIL